MSTRVINGKREPMNADDAAAIESSRGISLEAAKGIKATEINEGFKEDMLPVSEQYTDEEIAGWAQMIEEVRAYREGRATQALDALAEHGPISDKAVIVSDIEARISEYARVYGEAVGRKRTREAALADATTREEIEAV